MATHCNILAWRIPMDRGSLADYSPRDRKVLDATERTEVPEGDLCCSLFDALPPVGTPASSSGSRWVGESSEIRRSGQ